MRQYNRQINKGPKGEIKGEEEKGVKRVARSMRYVARTSGHLGSGRSGKTKRRQQLVKKSGEANEPSRRRRGSAKRKPGEGEDHRWQNSWEEEGAGQRRLDTGLI